MKERMFWVDIDYACFGLISKLDIVESAPPIVKWMIGKPLKEIKPWLLSKKAKVIEVNLNKLEEGAKKTD